MTQIRLYQPEDYQKAKEILELGGRYWEVSDSEQALLKKISQDKESIIVATDDGNIVGVMIITSDFLPFFFRLSVHPDYRRKGIGKKLVEKGESILKSRGANHINIIVSGDNKDAQTFYEKMGYERGGSYVWFTKGITP
ncbi:MAG TPA: GNAT family N-acetyltransferase [archaeon]|nr:GNAT family N-acetyltransferase [archaeon]